LPGADQRVARRGSGTGPPRRAVSRHRPLRRRQQADEVMPRRACIAVTAAASVALALPGAALSRRHRVHSVAPPLPHAAAVDEQEWSVQPSQTVLAAGRITFTGYDRGQDAHNMAIIGPHGQIAAIAMKPGGS